jgi:hypothetical protein
MSFSNDDKSKVRVYSADDVSEGVDVSITGNSTNPIRFQAAS